MSDLVRGRYEQIEVVGVGGQGRVVKARDHVHDRLVALKIRALHNDAERDALLSEAGILFRLPPSPHLPIVREDFFDGDDYVIVMDWVEGTDLARILHTDGRPGLPPTLVVQWLADAAAALTHLHAQDQPVLHGDIKPANLILTKGGRVSLVDFGASSTALTPGRRGGTPGYAAPERASQGTCTRAADIYSLAATAFALLTGEPPTGVRPSWEGVEPEVAAQLESAIREGLATDPARRPATPGGLVERLRAGWVRSLPTGVLTFCFTDIVGSTKLWDEQPEAMSRALVLHDKTIATAVERHGGRLISAMGEGDSTVSVFDSPTRAVAAAIDLTRDLAAVSWPSSLAITARAALHTGEVEFRDGNYFGVTPTTTARLRGLADGGQIFVSGETASLVRSHLPDGAELVDLGAVRLRGLAERVQTYAIAAEGVDAPPPATDCPYPGLVAFGPDDADRYFGRDTVIDDLVARLGAHRFVAVIGASGSGKSSLLQAGVAARWPGGADVVTPAASPVLDGAAVASSERLLVVDQFEELFTQVESPEVRGAFVDALLDAQRPVAIGLRADYYGSCAGYPRLAIELASHQLLLGPMSREELRAAIEEPARRAGVGVEAGLVELLVNEAEGEPAVLPLLAHALRATWDARDERTLTLDAYRTTGGVRGAIAATANHLMDSLDEIDRGVAQHILLRLVEPGDGIDDTRRRATLSELRPAIDDGGRTDRVVDAFVASRLVSVDAGAVQVAHEALIREWPQLRAWLADQRDDLRMQRQVTDAAEAWASGGREPTELYRGPRLAAAVDWLDRNPHASAIEVDFVTESKAEEERSRLAQVRANRRLRASLVGVAIALVVAIIGAAVAIARSREASDARDHADVARLAAVSRSLIERQPDLGLLLSVEAYLREDSHESRSALLAAVQRHPLLFGLVYGAESGLEAALFTPDGRTLATPGSDGTALWDVATRRRIAMLQHPGDVVLDASISPNGDTLAAVVVSADEEGNPASHLQVWDLATHNLLHRIESPAGGLTTASFSSDGRSLVTQGGAYFDRPPKLTAVVWDTATWTPNGQPWILRDEYLDDKVTVVSADGQVLAIVDGDGATVFDVLTRTERNHIRGDGEVSALALSADGRVLAVGLASGAVQVADTRTGATVLTAVTGSDMATSMEFSPDEAILAVGNNAGRTQLIDVATGTPVGTPLAASSAEVKDVAFSADGNMLATAGLDRTGGLWRLDGDRSIGTSFEDHAAVATHVEATADGSRIVTSGADGTVVVRHTTTGATRSVPIEGEVLALDVDQRGERIALGTTTGELRVLTLRDLRTVASTTFDGASVDAVQFDPRSRVVAVGVNSHPGESDVPIDDAGFISLFDPSSAEEVAPRVVKPGGSPIAFAWSHDGSALAAVYNNNVLRLFGPGPSYEQDGDDIAIADDPMGAVAISPDGSSVAVGTASGIVRQFDVASHEPVGAPLRGLAFDVRGVTYSADGFLLAATTAGLSTTRVWDATTGTPLGDEFVAGRVPYTVRTLPIDHPYPSVPAFAPNGDTLYAPVADGSVVAWDMRPSSWVTAACSVVGRDLTVAEWRQYVGDSTYRRTCSSRSGS